MSGERDADRRLLELTRGDELRRLEELIGSSRTTLLYARSGCGRTSLVDAGVVPSFKERGFAVFRTRPRPPWARLDPTLAFKECILRQLAEVLRGRDDQLMAALAARAEPSQDFRPLLNRLEHRRLAPAESLDLARAQLPRYSGMTLADFAAAVGQLLGGDRETLLICDHFEELFVHFCGSSVLERFADQLGLLVARESLHIHLLFSLREEWVGSMSVFRKPIPKIFDSQFRLLPMTRQRAELILASAFPENGDCLPGDVLQNVLADLTASYTAGVMPAGAAATSGGIAEADDFIDLPALHLVADRLWQGLEAHDIPATAAGPGKTVDPRSSLSLGPRPVVASPAELALGHYLWDAIAGDGSADDEGRIALTLDCLYLLTDGESQRRAATIDQLQVGLVLVRPAELNLPAPAGTEIQDALEPLVRRGLVHQDEGDLRESEYELAHDFAVHTVVREWRELDRRRNREVGRHSGERRRRRPQPAKPANLQRTLATLLQVLPVLGLICLLVGGWMLRTQPLSSLEIASHSLGPSMAAIGIFCAVAALGAAGRNRAVTALGALGVLAAIGLCVAVDYYTRGFEDRQRSLRASAVQQIDQLIDLIQNRPDSTHQVGQLEEMSKSLQDLQEPQQGTPAPATLPRLLPSQQGTAVLANDPRFQPRWRLDWTMPLTKNLRADREFARKQFQLTETIDDLLRPRFVSLRAVLLLLGAAAFALVLIYLHSLAGLAIEMENPRLGAVSKRMWSELADMLLLALLFSVAFAGTTYLPAFQGLADGSKLAVAAALALTISIIWTKRRGSTPGLEWTGFALGAPRAADLGWTPIIVRQVLLLGWTALNLFFLLPWLIGSSLLFRYDAKLRSAYDYPAGTRPLVESPIGVASAPQPRD